MRDDETPLMAKSHDQRFSQQELTVTGHCLRVGRAATAIVGHLSVRLQEALKLTQQELALLIRVYILAAFLHDIGKANRTFQDMIVGVYQGRHPFSHELISAIMLHHPAALQGWLQEELSREELGLTAMIVAGHHLRAGQQMEHPKILKDEILYLGDPSLLPLWERVKDHLCAQQLPSLSDLPYTAQELGQLVGNYKWECEDVAEELSLGERMVLHLSKGLLISADIIGSSKTEDEQSIEDWIDDSLNNRLQPQDLQGVIVDRLGTKPPYPFQQRVAESKAQVTLVTAGCGNGKTLAGYLWAQTHAIDRKLVFCYPTTGTASAGFADYLLAQTELERALLHSRAAADVEALTSAPDEEGGDPLPLWAPDVLDLWRRKVIACTVDAVLGFLSHWRRSLASLPVWLHSAFVFDEIHSYDHQLFGALLAFLRSFQVPCLLMTASLSQSRRQALEEALGEPIEAIKGNPAIESALRYEITCTTKDAAYREVQEVLSQGGKVLWVANTVGRAQNEYQHLNSLSHISGKLYHSRFRYADRVTRQQEVINAFRGQGAALVVATQVCEMSLDISADLLVTELAPFPSLIQRLGRLNRRDHIPSHPRKCLVIQPENARPYKEKDLLEAKELLQTLGTAPLSQAALAATLDQLKESPYKARNMPFFTQTICTEPGPLRQPSYGITLVREEDLAAHTGSINRAALTRMEIPMNQVKRHPTIHWRRLRGVPVAPAGTILYTAQTGATWVS